MDFVSNQQFQIKEMLQTLGIQEIGQLWENIPEALREPAPIVDDGLSELEGTQLLEKIADKNKYHLFESYLGAGAYDHYVPALVRSIILKSGFLTAYTPYQPEASQGLLQTIFEYQTAVCRLTGLEVANASLYDGASACAEALLMAKRASKKRSKVLVAKNLHPHYLKVIQSYFQATPQDLIEIPMTIRGEVDLKTYEKLLTDQVAAVLFAYPNFFGGVENLSLFFKKAEAKGAIKIVCANPLIYGLYASAKDLGADIAVGDMQPIGIPLQFGGPYAGYLSCRRDFLRQIPGRLVGKTFDGQGREGFVLTLQTREQHIRREKATSNICTNQALCALASLVAMLWYGPEGLSRLALTNFQRTEYLKKQLSELPGVEIIHLETPTFNEFTIAFEKPIEEVIKDFHLVRIEPGLNLKSFYPHLENHLLVNVTEMKSLEMLDRYIGVAKRAVL